MSVEVRVYHILKGSGGNNPEKKVVVDLDIIELQESASFMFDCNKCFQGLVEFLGRAGEEKVFSIGNVAPVDKMTLKKLPRCREALDLLAVLQNRNDLFHVRGLPS